MPRFLGWTIATIAGALLLAGCAMNLERVQRSPRSVALTTTGPWSSMIYLARTDSGVIAIDLGWIGADDALDEGLARLGAGRADVAAVFLTHSHRDHMAGWRAVKGARFHLGRAEIPLLVGRDSHAGLIPSAVGAIVEADRPTAGELDLHGLTRDTAFAFGRDTVYAFPVPGHTPGSTAYLFRGVLFMGDALAYTPLRGFHPAKRLYSADVERSRASVDALRDRLDGFEVEYVCTAHAKCAAPDSSLRAAAAH